VLTESSSISREVSCICLPVPLFCLSNRTLALALEHALVYSVGPRKKGFEYRVHFCPKGRQAVCVCVCVPNWEPTGRAAWRLVCGRESGKGRLVFVFVFGASWS